MTNKFHMWGYWRNKKGYEDALEHQYAEQLATDPLLSAALYQIKAAQALIDKRMEELEETGEDRYE